MLGLPATLLFGGNASVVRQNDPYIWLERTASPRVDAWVRAQNAQTLAILQTDVHYDDVYREALAVAKARARLPVPQLLAGRVLNFWQGDNHVRGVWREASFRSYRKTDPNWKTLIDLDALAHAEGTNLSWAGADCEEPEEPRCMIALSHGGQDAIEEREFDISSGRFVHDGFRLPYGKQSAVWEGRNTLLVAREWSPRSITSSGYPFIVKRLRRGQRLDEATELFRGSAEDAGYGVSPLVFEDGQGRRAILIKRSLSTFRSEYYLVAHGAVERLYLPPSATVQAIVRDYVIVSLTEDWPLGAESSITQGSIVAFDMAQAISDSVHLRATTIYEPEHRESVQQIAGTRNGIVITTLKNVQGRALLFRLGSNNKWTRQILSSLPDDVSINVVCTDVHSDVVILGITGFLQPPSLWLVDVNQGSATEIKELPPQFDASRETVEQSSAKSEDGTEIPYFVIRPTKLLLNGSNPTILTAYGGFGVSLAPDYSPDVGKLWLEKGYIFVVANIRGGGEFGPAWHNAARKTNRQRAYDDFAAVARDLFARHITNPRRLGIEGASNGGLLMGVEFIQHPSYWHAVDMQVPILDMMRFQKIASGSSWTGEYGSISVPRERKFLRTISPYANLKHHQPYPTPLIWTITNDDRVGPGHARKFAAKLAEYGVPYFFFEAREGGHTVAASSQIRAHLAALEMTYFMRELVN